MVLVKKKSGEYRFCVDYRALNAVTRKDVFLMPRIDNMSVACPGFEGGRC